MTSIWRFNEGSPAKSSSKTSHRHRAGLSSCCKARAVCRRDTWDPPTPAESAAQRAEGAAESPPGPDIPFHRSCAETGKRRPARRRGGQRRTRATCRGCHGPPRALCLPPTAHTSPWLHFGFSTSFLFLIIREKQSLRAFELHNSLCKRGTGRLQPRPRRALHPLPLCPARAKVLLPPRSIAQRSIVSIKGNGINSWQPKSDPLVLDH